MLTSNLHTQHIYKIILSKVPKHKTNLKLTSNLLSRKTFIIIFIDKNIMFIDSNVFKIIMYFYRIILLKHYYNFYKIVLLTYCYIFIELKTLCIFIKCFF